MVIARHGRTAWHDQHLYAGSSDIPIDDTGARQAMSLAAWAQAFAPDALVCSPMLRARQTTEPIATALELPVRTDERLRELDFGTAEGRSLADLGGDVAQLFREDPVTHHLPGGEDPRAGARRAATWLWDVAGAHEGQRVLAVAHNTLIRLLVCHVTGIPLDSYRRRLPGVGSTHVTRLRVEGREAGLEAYNVPVPEVPEQSASGAAGANPWADPHTSEAP